MKVILIICSLCCFANALALPAQQNLFHHLKVNGGTGGTNGDDMSGTLFSDEEHNLLKLNDEMDDAALAILAVENPALYEAVMHGKPRQPVTPSMSSLDWYAVNLRRNNNANSRSAKGILKAVVNVLSKLSDPQLIRLLSKLVGGGTSDKFRKELLGPKFVGLAGERQFVAINGPIYADVSNLEVLDVQKIPNRGPWNDFSTLSVGTGLNLGLGSIPATQVTYEPPKRIIEEEISYSNNQNGGWGDSLLTSDLFHLPSSGAGQLSGNLGNIPKTQTIYEPSKRIVEEEISYQQHYQPSQTSNQNVNWQSSQQRGPISAYGNIPQTLVTYEAPKRIIEEETSYQQQTNRVGVGSNQQQGGFGLNLGGSGLGLGFGVSLNQGQQQLGSGDLQGSGSSLSEVIYERPNSQFRKQQSQQNIQYGGGLSGGSFSYYEPPKTIVEESVQQTYSTSNQGGVQFPIQENAQYKAEPLRPHQVTKTEYVVGGNNQRGQSIDEMTHLTMVEDRIIGPPMETHSGGVGNFGSLLRSVTTAKPLVRVTGTWDIPGLFTTKKTRRSEQSVPIISNINDLVLVNDNQPGETSEIVVGDPQGQHQTIQQQSGQQLVPISQSVSYHLADEE